MSGLHIDSVLTSTFEAMLYDIDASEDEIRDSAQRLMSIIREVISIKDPREMRTKILEEYTGNAQATLFNRKSIIAL